MKRQLTTLLIGISTIVWLTGCASKFTRENFNMIQVGVDDREDVRQILGEPTSDLEDQWFYDDVDKYHSAVVHFDTAGRVLDKEWIDSVTGEWDGHNPNVSPPPEGEVRERHTKTRRIDD